MLFLTLIYALALASGWSIASILALPTRLLRWTMAVAAGCGVLILSIQILSLFHQLDGGQLLIANTVAALGLGGLATYIRRGRKPVEPDRSSKLPLRQFLSELGSINVVFGAFVLLTIIFVMLAAWVLFPANDAYHLNMCLFWKQNKSIQAFAAPDPRVVSVVFASEALAFPGYLYANSPVGFIGVSVAAAFLIACLIYALSVGVGSSRRVALIVSLVFSVSTPLITAILGGKSDFLFSTLWLLGSLHCLLETRSFPERTQSLLGCSVFLFGMACGAKNTIALQAPAYALAILLLAGPAVLRPRLLGSSALAGIMGLALSGVIWSYAQNHFWFGDWRGHPFVKETLARDYDGHAVWTRLTRAFVSLAYDTSWLPAGLQPAYAHLATGTIRALGGTSVLPEDDGLGLYSFDPAVIRPGIGMGLLGPVLVIPSLAVATVLLFRKKKMPESDETDRFRALTVFSLVSFLVCYAVLRTQMIGVTRLMLACVAAAMPLSMTILRTRFGYWIGMTAAVLSLAINCLSALGLALYRLDSKSLPLLTKLKRTPISPAQAQWDDSSPQDIAIREPYTNRELYGMISERLQRAKVVGLIGGPHADAQFCFGPDISKQVVVLKDCRSNVICKPDSSVDCIIVEDFDPQTIDPSILHGYRAVLQVSRNQKAWFAYLEREPQS